MKPDLSATPRLARDVRLNEKTQLPRMLLTSKQSLRLQGPSLAIIQLCDGRHTVQQIAEQVQRLYPKAEPHRVTEEILGYLELLHGQQAIEF
jgi:hypothetical protein